MYATSECDCLPHVKVFGNEVPLLDNSAVLYYKRGMLGEKTIVYSYLDPIMIESAPCLAPVLEVGKV